MLNRPLTKTKDVTKLSQKVDVVRKKINQVLCVLTNINKLPLFLQEICNRIIGNLACSRKQLPIFNNCYLINFAYIHVIF
jgi:hypothetical protein